jgi:hypothetical protein
LRRFLSLTSACALVLFGGLARAQQQIDIAVGGSTLYSFKLISASEAFQPPPEKGGTYPTISAQVLLTDRLGVNAELAFRYHQGLYNGFQNYRPVIYDFNAVYAPRLSRKMTADVMAGVGGERLIFYNSFSGCPVASSGCIAYLSSNHFLGHLGVGVRYRFWRHFFVRPEAHYYLINNNFEFHSDNLFRIGASIGYTLGSK